MKTRTGTNHFKNLDAAIKYYAVYNETRDDVLEKWRNYEICIGPPKIKDKERLTIDNDGRYWIDNY
jgi:hypothetical protein